MRPNHTRIVNFNQWWSCFFWFLVVFRQKCLDEHWFLSLEDATEKVDVWRLHYNEERPHSSLGY
jgi:transposase InsO family protein